ncbi:MAG: hypothetical protein EDM70_11780 [Candidatus Brocadia sp. AMX2]|nr:MAG: hypothetical protein EDM70_11780 [Candidatus Brocadia sp. AMX2]
MLIIYSFVEFILIIKQESQQNHLLRRKRDTFVMYRVEKTEWRNMKRKRDGIKKRIMLIRFLIICNLCKGILEVFSLYYYFC